MLAELRSHRVAVVALGEGHQQFRLLGPGLSQDVLVGAAAAHGVAAERGRQPVEGARRRVDHGDLLTTGVELGGGPGTDPTAAHDDDPHEFSASSSVSARRHHTGAVELRITYGTVRPASHCPPNRRL